MQAAAIILAVAALGGFTLAGIRLSGKPQPPTWMAIAHGLIAATGLVVLASAVLQSEVPAMAKVSLGVLVLAAFGGAGIFVGFHLRKKPLPIPLVIGHGLVAVTGYVLLLISAFHLM